MFNPNEHLTQLQGKDYLEVKWRLVWFREQCPGGTIDTEELEYDTERPVEAEVFVWNQEKRRKEKIIKQSKGYARYRAVVTDGNGARATGTKSENAANFPDFGEKAETGAIGRALAALGYGTQFTGGEFDEGERIVDSPVERHANQEAQSNGAHEEAKVTEQQLSSIHKLCEYLGKSEPEGVAALGYLDAKKLINQLTAEYRESKARPQQSNVTQETTAKQQVTLASLKSEAVKRGFITGKTPEELKASWLDQLNQIFDGKVPTEAALSSPANLARINGAIEQHKRAVAK